MKKLVLVVSLLSGFVCQSLALDITDEVRTSPMLPATQVNLYGRSELHLTGSDPIPARSQLGLYSEDAWVFFTQIKPSEVLQNYLGFITVFDAPASTASNVRIVQYLQGAVVIPHGPAYRALEVFTEPDWQGSNLLIEPYTYYRGAGKLGGRANMNNSISSFRLKRGYMATFAQEDKGTGISKVYVAANGDMEIAQLPEGLDNDVSFIRVIPWRWAHKKGWAGGTKGAPETLNCAWRYDWNNAAKSTLDVEYIPMRHNKNWNKFENINNKQGSTHVLGFNEPERPDQANMTVDQALAQWPRLMESGLRLGSPAPSDGGRNWLYEFIDRCDELNYRVDFVAVHYYHGGRTAQQYYNWLKQVHDRTGRPLWVTEWNNGANWTCCKPTYAEQAQKIEAFLNMLDNAPFVERYSIYNWVGDTRAVISKSDPITLTPAGEVYRDKVSPMAFAGAPTAPVDLVTQALSSRSIRLTWLDESSNESGFVIQRRGPTGTYKDIAQVGKNVYTYTDNHLLGDTTYTYRIAAYNSAGHSAFSNESIETTPVGPGVLPQDGWTVHYVDSEETDVANNKGVYAIDGDPQTIWHTAWHNSVPRHPHEIQIDLGTASNLAGLLYLPRQDSSFNGTIARYEIYVSVDGKQWGTAVASGTWVKTKSEKEVQFPPKTGRYLRLLARTEVNGQAWTSAAEINVLVNSPKSR